jgi:hypothetical protein
MSHEIFNKTPSRVSYNKTSGTLKTWGVLCDPMDNTTMVKELFKLYLDPTYQDDFQDMNHEDAIRYYHDFLVCIHQHIARHFARSLPQWSIQHVEWIFSVPTTWKNQTHIRTLEDIIRRAGFGQDGQNHSCRVTLTEAEAAAICVAKQQLEVGSATYRRQPETD